MPAPSGFDYVPTTKSNSTRSIAAHSFDKLRAGSCEKRKDGAPSVGMVHAKIVKAGPSANCHGRWQTVAQCSTSGER